MSGYLEHISTAVPPHRYRQSDLLPYMVKTHGGDPLIARQLRLLYERGGIESRHSVLADFFPGQKGLLYGQNGFPGLSKRLDHFKTSAVELAAEAALKCLTGHCAAAEITHIVTVSCTGLFAPGLEFQLIKKLGLAPTVGRHPINFVGCYAAIPALHLANLICLSDPYARVLLVSVELCSLHFQKDDSRDNLMANALFADGAAACLVVGEELASTRAWRIGKQYGEVHAQGEEEMAWEPSERGFLMRLTSYVPRLIRSEIRSFVEEGLRRSGVNGAEVEWAFHPGGVQILRKVEEAMEIGEEDLENSYRILRDHGNMSSATVLFVLEEMMKGEGKKPHAYCCAFGPGLTFESILLHRV